MSDFSPMAPGSDGQFRLARGDERMFVVFERRSRQNMFKSGIEGRPIYEPVDYVRIQQPGERDVFIGPVTDEHRQRWPDRWEKYLKGVEQTPEGVPVQILFPNQPEVVDLLLDLRIQTIEQLASLTEHAIERLGMEGRRYVQKAQAALDQSKATQEVTRVTAELEDVKSKYEVLQRAHAQVIARLDMLEALREDEIEEERGRRTRKRVTVADELAQPEPAAPPPPKPQRAQLV